MSAVGPLALPRTSKMCVVVAARRHPLHKCAMMQPRGCGSRDVPRKCPVQTRVRADVRRSFGWGRVVVRVVCAMCARAVSERGAKRRSPPLRHPHTVLLPVSALQAVAESSVGCLHGWRCAVACPLLACACSFGRWQRSRVQAKSEYTHGSCRAFKLLSNTSPGQNFIMFHLSNYTRLAVVLNRAGWCP